MILTSYLTEWVEDMIALSDLTEESIVENLKKRYASNLIYVSDMFYFLSVYYLLVDLQNL